MNSQSCNEMAPPIHSIWNIIAHLIPPLLALLIPFGLLNAGEYHSLYNGTLYCDECHITSSSDNSGIDQIRNSLDRRAESFPHMLKREGNQVCMDCHDNNMEVSDVVGPNRGCSPDIVREAGALNSIDGSYPYRPEFGHTLGSIAVAPGSRPSWAAVEGLMCIDCHDPHGENPNGNPYRNLIAYPGNTQSPGVIVTYSVDMIDPARDVFIRNRSDYDITSVDFNEPVPNYSAIADFCQGCHNEFHAGSESPRMGMAIGTGWVRHPSGDADIGHVGGRHSSRSVFAGNWMAKDNFVKVMTGTGNWTPRSSREVVDHSPTCITCHKAHGNRNPFGLIYMGNTGTVTEEGTTDGKYTDLCRQCHIQSFSDSQLTRR